MKGKIKRNIFLTVIFTIIIYMAFTFYGDYDIVILSLKNFEWKYLPIALIVIYITFLLKFIKWQYYLSLVNVDLKLSTSFNIFMSSLTMSITPGKIGDLIKPYIIREVDGTSISKTIPIVFAERVTEFLSLLLIILIGFKVFEMDISIVLLSLIIFVLGLVFILNNRTSSFVLNKLKNFKMINRFIEPIEISLINSSNLLRVKPFVLMYLLSILIWLVESFAFFLIVLGFSEKLPIINTLFTYLLSVFAGSVSVIPAGLGITDGSITYLLGREGVESSVAISIAFITRIATLWFSLIIGSASLAKITKITGTIDLHKQ